MLKIRYNLSSNVKTNGTKKNNASSKKNYTVSRSMILCSEQTRTRGVE